MASSSEPLLAATQRPATADIGVPSLSVVVASHAERSRLLEHLASPAGDAITRSAELIIVRADTTTRIFELTKALPWGRVIPAPPNTRVAELRSIGLANATGDILALTADTGSEDRSDIRWIEALLRRCSRHLTLIGETDDVSDESTWSGYLARHGVSVFEGADQHAATIDGATSIEPPSIEPPASTEPPRCPYLSVIVPAHAAAGLLPRSLQALADSELPRAYWELIVVDDASGDATASIAARFADVVVRLPGKPYGPAYARNRGFEVARGECVVFLDADVCVYPDTLTQFALALGRAPEVSAVFGSFDVRSKGKGLGVQYRNLLTHYYHQQNAGPAETFWSSCGAIRRDAFIEAGMFDEWHFPRRQIEDFELGRRIRRRGRQIVLHPEIRATHLKNRTLRGMIAADLYDRALPWMRLFGGRPTTGLRRNAQLRALKKQNTVLAWLALALTVIATYAHRLWPLIGAGLCVLLVLVNNRAQYRFFARKRGLTVALAAVPFDFLSYFSHGVGITYGRLLREMIGEPKPHPTVEAFSEVGVRMWPPVPRKRADDG
jgi:glycosyltransferase involved in cell wall biosynthesis